MPAPPSPPRYTFPRPLHMRREHPQTASVPHRIVSSTPSCTPPSSSPSQPPPPSPSFQSPALAPHRHLRGRARGQDHTLFHECAAVGRAFILCLDTKNHLGFQGIFIVIGFRSLARGFNGDECSGFRGGGGHPFPLKPSYASAGPLRIRAACTHVLRDAY